MKQDLHQRQEATPSLEVVDTSPHPQCATALEAIEAPPLQEQVTPIEVLGTTLSQEAHRFRRNILCGIGGMSVFGALLIVVKSLLGEDKWNELLPAHLVISGTLSALLILSLFIVNSSRRPRQRRRILTARVAEQHDVRAIGPLVDALHLDDPMTREIAIARLTDLLPRLKASDSALLNESQRARLCHLLSLPVESPLHKDIRALFRPADSRAIAFRVAILQAFEQVGNSKVLPIVKQLAAKEPRTQGERDIHEAAVACLPAVQLREEQVKSSQTLLRASDLSYVASDTLLRAAAESQEVVPEELLRPSECDTFTNSMEE